MEAVGNGVGVHPTGMMLYQQLNISQAGKYRRVPLLDKYPTLNGKAYQLTQKQKTFLKTGACSFLKKRRIFRVKYDDIYSIKKTVAILIFQTQTFQFPCLLFARW